MQGVFVTVGARFRYIICKRYNGFNQCQLQPPINFLTNEKIIKGYNKYGQPVNVYDGYGNYVVIEYERYDVHNLDKVRIKQIYDNQKNLIVFSYNLNEKFFKKFKKFFSSRN